MTDPATPQLSIPLKQHELRSLIRGFLSEDVGSGDVTTDWLVSPSVRATGEFIARDECILAGIDLAREVFRVLDPAVRWKSFYKDGQRVLRGRAIARVEARAHALLTGERVALNSLQRLSGIATTTCRFVQAVRGTHVKILDTRKTTPGWRALEKYAVRCGGGHNHRFGLDDAILIKDNHLIMAGSVRGAILRARRRNVKGLPLEVEVASREQLREALDLCVDRILLDNMTPQQVRRSVAVIRKDLCGQGVIVECSGGITLKSVKAYARAGVDWISVGALTHSARAADISFEMKKAN